MTKMQTFAHNMFGNLEVFNKDGKEYFQAKDVAKELGYTNPHKAIRDHCK
ncbi:BRO family protein, partial [Bacillus thuringiensis]|nr:BRO family protein [Bacillus thuringiensis]